MKSLEWTTRDRTGWRSGPWDSEPDKMQWPDAETGLPCLIVRGPSGALCGYVGVGPDHPLYRVQYSEESEKLAAALERRLDQPLGDSPGVAILLAALSGKPKASPAVVFSVHGGLTFSDACHAPTREGWERFRARVASMRDEAARFPQGDSTRALREWGDTVDDFEAFCERKQQSAICHLAEPGDFEPAWWFGFDCAHLGDDYPARGETSRGRWREPGDTYKDVAYVRRECEKLAAQLAAVA